MNCTNRYWHKDCLTHWPLGNIAVDLKVSFSTSLYRVIAWVLTVAFRPRPQNLTSEKLLLIQVMALCHQATNHYYLNQCGPRIMLPYDVTWPQWVNLIWTVKRDPNYLHMTHKSLHILILSSVLCCPCLACCLLYIHGPYSDSAVYLTMLCIGRLFIDL